MKKLFLLLSLFVGLKTFAQEPRRTFLVLGEYRVKDLDILKKNFPIGDAYYKKALEGVITDRLIHSSESGAMYLQYIMVGDANLGKFMAIRNDLTNKFKLANPKIVQEGTDNTDGPFRRSTWIVVNELRFLPKDFKGADFNFRKVIFRTVPADQQEAFEKKMVKIHELEEKMGLVYNIITFKAVDGYPSNTYLTIVQDNSLLDYYKHYVEREEKRKTSKEFTDLIKASPLASSVRFDHLKLIN